MLTNETISKLRQMRLIGMAEAYEQQLQQCFTAISFDDRFGSLVDQEWYKRSNRRIYALQKQAGFVDSSACLEDLDYSPERKLDAELIQRLALGDYLRHAHNVIITGATGAGKSFLAQALGVAACRQKFKTKYLRLNDLLEILGEEKDKGLLLFQKSRKTFETVDLLILDEFLLFALNEEESKLLADIVERRYRHTSTIVISQFEPAEWIPQIPNALAAESITDRLANHGYSIFIDGLTSMRKRYAFLD